MTDPTPQNKRSLQRSSTNIVMLKGNHEIMMLKAIQDNDYYYNDIWQSNGGDMTSYSFKALPKKEQKDILDFISSCDTYKILPEGYILVHAGMEFENYDGEDAAAYLSRQSENDMLWIRPDIFKSHPLKGYKIIVGHTPTPLFFKKRAKPAIVKSENWIAIDCGVCFVGGKLGCLRLDDMVEFYVD